MKGHLRQRGKSGAWYAVIDIGRGPDGKRQQKWHRLKATGKRTAETELTRLLHSLTEGTYVEPNKLTVAEYLDTWLQDVAKPRLTARSALEYGSIVERHLKAHLGGIPLVKLQPLHIQSMYAALLRDGRKDKRAGGLSPETIHKIHKVLSSALRQAVKWNMIVRNTLDAVEKPKRLRTEIQALDETQTVRLIEAVKGSYLHMPVFLAVGTGMRRGEILALKWRDVDLKNGRLTVQRALEQIKDKITEKEPKTDRSRRTIALPSMVVEALVAHRREQRERKLRLGPAYQDNDLICERGDGTHISPVMVSMAFGRLVRRLGFPEVSFHGLRHGHASHLLRENVPMKVVSERLGHASISITMDRYSHILPGMQEDAVRKLDDSLRRAMRDMG